MSAVIDPHPVAELELARERVCLHAERALFWPRERALVLADLHLGKGQVFRQAGIALPRGGTASDLARLETLIACFDPARIVILGDMLHGPLPPDAPWLAQWRAWRAMHAAREVVLIAGNHDRAVDASLLGLDAVQRRWDAAPFRLEHEAHPSPGVFTLGGHLHPVLRLRTAGLNARLPVLWATADHAVLPAFTAFAGGYRLEPERGDRVWICAPDSVVQVPLPR